MPGTLRIAARSPSDSHSIDPLNLNVTHHVDLLVFRSPHHDGWRKWWGDTTPTAGGTTPTAKEGSLGEAGLRSQTFVMHEQATTLKHYMKVVRTRRQPIGGVRIDSYDHSNFYNEYHDQHKLTPSDRLAPNALFSYDVSPFRVVHQQSSESFGSYLTQLCAVVGGVFTVFGILDGMLHGVVKVIKQD